MFFVGATCEKLYQDVQTHQHVLLIIVHIRWHGWIYLYLIMIMYLISLIKALYAHIM